MSDKAKGRTSKEPLLAIGDHPLQRATLMMGHGYDPRLSEGAIKPPVFLTSTYVFESAAAGKRHFEALTGKGDRPGHSDSLVYSRFNGPDQQILEERLAVLEGGEEALAFSSGMAAISTLLLACAGPGDVIVHSAPLYASTETMIDGVLGRFGVQHADFPAAASPEAIERTLRAAGEKGRIALVYLESPANPTNALVDLEAVRAIVDRLYPEAPPPIAIDNTFLGPLWQQPLRHGADLSVYSLTKYMGGHSDLVAGGVIGARKWIQPIRMLRNNLGTIIDPHPAWLLLRSLETVFLRMERAGANAARICAFLRDHPKVEKVVYPGFLADEEGPQADIYRRHCSGGGSTFSVYLKGGEREVFAFLDALRLIRLAVSLGGTESLASAPAAMTHLSVSAERKKQLGIRDNLVRISLGIEDAGDLEADLRQALAAL